MQYILFTANDTDPIRIYAQNLEFGHLKPYIGSIFGPCQF